MSAMQVGQVIERSVGQTGAGVDGRAKRRGPLAGGGSLESRMTERRAPV
jgi:hypothetical protein